MIAWMLKRFKSDLAPVSHDLNKKIMDAFSSIIDKGARNSISRLDPILEAIPKYNVEPSTAANSQIVPRGNQRSRTSTSPITLNESQSSALVIKNPPDIFRRSKLSPINLHKNVFLMSKMLSPTGSIVCQEKTKLTSKTHRHLSKAIRRARQMGILPYMYKPKVHAVKI